MNSILLEADNISKKYNNQKILTDINLSVPRGETIALVGENGCGKSTLLRILAGLTRPTSGIIHLPDNIQLGFIPDRYEKINLTIPKFLFHMQAMEGHTKNHTLIENYYRLFYLDNMLDTPMRYLSKGTLQKVAVIQALISHKDLLFMDEPLSGQDTLSQYHFANEMQKRKSDGTTMIVACHETYLIEELADRILQIKDGKLIDGTAYIYSHHNTKSIFIILNEKNSKNPENLIQLNKEDFHINNYGNICKIETNKENAKQLFLAFLANDIPIIKYEEI